MTNLLPTLAWNRRRLVQLGLGGTALLPLAGFANQHDHSGTPVATPPSGTDEASWLAQMNAYAETGTFPAVQENDGNLTSSVTVEIPAIDFTGEGTSSTLPTGPLQYIYRFQDSEIEAPEGANQPFQYVEIDWNTEGAPRGPGGSFSSPHFDFHFYVIPLATMEQDLVCVSSNGKTCDGFLTDYDQMRRFQLMPEQQYVPELYRPDVGSAIPIMGLHLLDMTQTYTVEAVNHYPVLIYGTFDGEVIFLEASVTLNTLQDAVAAPDHRITFEVRQPAAFQHDIDWPTEFVIEHLSDTGGFRVGYTGFVRQTAS